MSKAAGNGSDQGCRAAGDIWKQGLTSHWCKPHFSGSEGPSPSFILRDNVNIPNYTVAPEATLFASGSPAKQIRLMVTGHTRKQDGVLVCPWVLFKVARRNCSFSRTYFFFPLLIAVSLLNLHVFDWQGHVAILDYFPLSLSFLFFPSDKCLLEGGSPEFRPCTGGRMTTRNRVDRGPASGGCSLFITW